MCVSCFSNRNFTWLFVLNLCIKHGETHFFLLWCLKRCPLSSTTARKRQVSSVFPSLLRSGASFDVVYRDTGYNFLFHMLFFYSSSLSMGWQTSAVKSTKTINEAYKKHPQEDNSSWKKINMTACGHFTEDGLYTRVVFFFFLKWLKV